MSVRSRITAVVFVALVTVLPATISTAAIAQTHV
jgi:Ca2+/Na+ antiporter